MPRRLRHRKSRRSPSFSKRMMLGAVLACLIFAAGIFLYSSGSLSSGFATLGKVIGLQEPAASASLPSAPAAMGAPQPAGTRTYIFGNGLVASKSSDGSVQYYHQDALGSNRVVTNSNGEIQSKSTAYPYGEPVQVEGFGSKQARYTFTGKELDSKLYYFGARYYNPRTMRFTSVDPANALGSAYEYAASNPLKFVDPDGNRAYYASPNQAKVDSLNAETWAYYRQHPTLAKWMRWLIPTTAQEYDDWYAGTAIGMVAPLETPGGRLADAAGTGLAEGAEQLETALSKISWLRKEAADVLPRAEKTAAEGVESAAQSAGRGASTALETWQKAVQSRVKELRNTFEHIQSNPELKDFVNSKEGQAQGWSYLPAQGKRSNNQLFYKGRHVGVFSNKNVRSDALLHTMLSTVRRDPDLIPRPDIN